MTTLFTILIVLAAILMILVVLVQKSKGGGLASSFSGSNAILGVKKTTDTIEKVTWGLAGFIIVVSIAVVSLAPKATLRPSVDVPVAPIQSAPDMSTGMPAMPLPEAPVSEGSAE